MHKTKITVLLRPVDLTPHLHWINYADIAAVSLSQGREDMTEILFSIFCLHIVVLSWLIL